MKRLIYLLLGLLALLLLFAFDQWLFTRWLGVTYWEWYLKNGALIGLVSAIVSKVWGDLLDEHTGLISPHPLDYLGACSQLIGLPVYVLGTQIRSNKDKSLTRSWADGLVAAVWVPVLVGSIFVWFVIIVPLQYLVYLVCGAPIRFTLKSDRLPVARFDSTRTRLKLDEINKYQTKPEGWSDASINRKPVSMTNVLAALLLWVLQRLLS